jgi:hypothetical protein
MESTTLPCQSVVKSRVESKVFVERREHESYDSSRHKELSGATLLGTQFFRLLNYHNMPEGPLRGTLAFLAPLLRVLRPFLRRKVGVAKECLHQFRGLICVYNTLLSLRTLSAAVSLRLCRDPHVQSSVAHSRTFRIPSAFFDFLTPKHHPQWPTAQYSRCYLRTLQCIDHLKRSPFLLHL